MKTRHEDSFFSFMESVAERLERLEKQRTAETYMSALKSFRRFVGRPRLAFSELDTDLTAAYEAYLIRRRGLTPNTSSFYMRILRAVYNRAVNQGLTTQNNPFRGVYTGVARTAKRAIPQQALPTHQGHAAARRRSARICKGHVPFLVLHQRDVVRRHGLPA